MHNAGRVQRRKLGLIGGMSWRSTALYYERLNRAVETALGPHRSFQGQIWNLDYADLLAAASRGDESAVAGQLAEAAHGLVQGGCGVVALTAVTAHCWYDAVCAPGAAVPHVLDAAVRKLDNSNVRAVGVLGTAMTCSSAFAPDRLGARGRRLLFLREDDQARIDALIQDVLTTGEGAAGARDILSGAIGILRSHGAEAVLLACTELPLLLPIADVEAPLIDCVALHVDDICNQILE